MNIRIKLLGSLLFITAMCGSASAESISPAMLQQLKSLPPAEQQALAKQYGVDLNAVAGQPAAPKPVAKPGVSLQQAQPVEVKAKAADEDKAGEISVKLASETVLTNEKLTPEERSETKVETLSRFGRSLFDANVSTFAPTDNSQVPPNYTLGVGDELIVQLFGTDNSQVNLQVGRDGMVKFPKLGAMSVAGLSFDDAKSMIQTRVNEQLIGVTALVSMGQLRAMNIFMAGEVAVPGAYSVSAFTTITQALFQSGGITDIGSLRNVQVKRNGELVATFDLYDLLLRGDMSGDLRLQSGDVVFVPPYEALVSMTGEVKRPAIYEIESGETLGDLLAMAGGYKSSAFAGELVVIKKRNPGELPEALNISANDDPQLQMVMGNGDVVRVLPLGDNVQRLVTLEGALARPGVYGWKEGLRVSDLVNDVRRDLLPDADLSYSLIIREVNPQLDISTQHFSLAEALSARGGEADPLLQPRDKVLVFSWPGVTQLNEQMAGVDFNSASNARRKLLAPIIAKLRSQADAEAPSRVVEISGAVKAPGFYPLPFGFTVEDMLVAAGGVDDSADTQALFVRRLVETEMGVSEYRTEEVAFTAAETFALQPRDRISVQQRIEWDPNQIKLSGAFKRSGSQPWRDGMRVSDVIENLRRDLNDTADVTYSLIIREVQGSHDIETLQFSLLDALAHPGTSADPLLQPRDELLAFDWGGASADSPNSRATLLAPVLQRLAASASASASEGVRIASISGGVKQPGRFPITRTSTIEDLIVAAGGASDAAFLDALEIRRNELDVSGQNRLKLVEVAQNEFATTLIQSRDHITVRERVNWTPDEKVRISGEVLFPGEYYLLPGEKLSDLVKRAGGLSDRASVRSAVFTRPSVAELERYQATRFADQIEREFAVSLLTQEETKGDNTTVQGITQSLRSYAGYGRVVVDLNSALLGDELADLELEGGDALHIPARSNVVSVVGEVRRTGSLTFEQNLALDDYLGLAAGTTQRADVDNIYVVKASGEVQRGETSWTQFMQATPRIEPGDTIVVPVNTQYKDSIPFWRDITQIIYQGTVTIAAALRF